MEVLFSQRMEYYSIQPFRNYSPITRNENIKERTENSLRNLLSFSPVSAKREIILRPKPKKGRKGLYYYGKSDDDVFKFKLYGAKKPIITTKEEHLKRHFGNPFSSVLINLTERSIVKRGDKIVIKLYERVKTRNVNHKYFRTRINITSISINTKTGNFTISKISTAPNKKQRKFRQNHFVYLLETIKMTRGLFDQNNHFGTDYIKENPDLAEFNKVFNDEEFIEKCRECLNINEGNETTRIHFFYEFLYYFVNKRNIKSPDNFMALLLYFYPTERYLKKNDRKQVAATLDRLGMKSKATIKLLHQRPHVDLLGLSKVCSLFGDDFPKYVSNIKSEVFKDINYSLENVNYQNTGIVYDIIGDNEVIDYEITKQEKDNILQIINTSHTDPHPILVAGHRTHLTQVCNDIIDHFRQLSKIQKEYPNFRLFARTHKSFEVEHRHYSKIYNLLKREYLKMFVYNQNTIDFLEEPIEISEDEKYYPYILKREDEYIEEGNFMHHCVGGYIRTDTSMIVSLRNEKGDVRVTNEYHFKNGNCIQSRAVNNGRPPDNFIIPLKKLQGRIDELHMKNMLKWESIDQVKTKEVMSNKLLGYTEEEINDNNELELLLEEL